MLKIKQALPSEASLPLALSRRALDALIAYKDSQPVGFLAFTGAFDGAFGDCKGVYSPLHGGFFGGSWCSAASARAAAT